jgi:hypothetical protein
VDGNARKYAMLLMMPTPRRKLLLPKDGDRPTNLHDAQEGVALDPYIVMCRLRKMNNNLHFEPSMHDKNKMGIYLLDPLAETGRGSFVEWSGTARYLNSQYERM